MLLKHSNAQYVFIDSYLWFSNLLIKMKWLNATNRMLVYGKTHFKEWMKNEKKKLTQIEIMFFLFSFHFIFFLFFICLWCCQRNRTIVTQLTAPCSCHALNILREHQTHHLRSIAILYNFICSFFFFLAFFQTRNTIGNEGSRARYLRFLFFSFCCCCKMHVAELFCWMIVKRCYFESIRFSCLMVSMSM